jgi:uncharacterized membrane protein
MGKGRFEAFSYSVITIITIMVIEMKVPMNSSPDALIGIIPVMISYILSFIYIGI